jgi:hypothetical protein
MNDTIQRMQNYDWYSWKIGGVFVICVIYAFEVLFFFFFFFFFFFELAFEVD